MYVFDADDQLSPDYLEHMYKIAVEKKGRYGGMQLCTFSQVTYF